MTKVTDKFPTINPTELTVVGIDEPVSETNRAFYESALADRAFQDQAAYNQGSRHSQDAWDALVSSISEFGVLGTVTIAKVDDKLYVVDGRRRVVAARYVMATTSSDDNEVVVKVPYRLLQKTEDPAKLKLQLNTNRLDYTELQKIEFVIEMKATGVKKELIANQLGISLNHVDVLTRLGSSIADIRHGLKPDADEYNSLIMSEAKKLADFYEDLVLQRKILNLYLRYRNFDFCESTRLSPSKVCMDFCQNCKTHGFDYVETYINEKIKEWLGDVPKSTNIINHLPDQTSSTSDNLDPGGNENESPDVVGSTETDTSKKTEDKPKEDTKASEDVPLQSAATKPNRAVIKELLFGGVGKDENFEAWLDGFDKTAQEVILWLTQGALPPTRRDKTKDQKYDNTGLCDFLVHTYPNHAKGLKDVG